MAVLRAYLPQHSAALPRGEAEAGRDIAKIALPLRTKARGGAARPRISSVIRLDGSEARSVKKVGRGADAKGRRYSEFRHAVIRQTRNSGVHFLAGQLSMHPMKMTGVDSSPCWI